MEPATVSQEEPRVQFPVLFVDDEAFVRRVFQRTAAAAGWSLSVAASAKEALALLERQPFAVVVSDFCMPEMDGIRFLSLVRERWPEAERLLMTAYADEDALERGINEAGISRFLRKPWGEGVLEAVVSEAMTRAALRHENRQLVHALEERTDQLAAANRRLSDRVDEGVKALDDQRQSWDVALNAIADPILIHVPGRCIVDGNEAGAHLLQADFAGDAGGLCFLERFGKQKDCDACPLAKQGPHITALRDGVELLFDARFYPLPGSESTLCVLRDVTRQRAYEREAAKVDKLAGLGRLAGGVAHELNNPLHAILTFAQLAQKPNVPPDKLQRYHVVIRDCAIRCRDIINNLRDFARQPLVGERKQMDLVKVCEKAMVLFEARTKVRLELAAQVQRAPAIGNANQMQQVVVNLLQNAIDVSPDGALVRVCVVDDADAWVLAVDDSGPGVAEHDQVKIFEPFYTTKPEGKGTGLGLAICHSIAQEHEGSLRVATGLLGGARFELRLRKSTELQTTEEVQTW